MMNTAARISGVVGSAAAFAIAMTRGGLSAWATSALTASALVLVAVVLFIPSETPARRLGHLIQAWRTPTGTPTGPEPAQPSAAPALPCRDGR
jgi:hypothetical protein